MDEIKVQALEKTLRDVSRHLYYYLCSIHGEEKSKRVISKVLIKLAKEYAPKRKEDKLVRKK